jgi:hypothetical protein
MERVRTIAAAPIRSAAEAWDVVTRLLTDTLERSPAISSGSVAAALAPLKGLGPALIAGGHLENRGLVLMDRTLHLTILVMTADAALGVEENLNPVAGGASATDAWTLHLPEVEPFKAAISAAVKKSKHLSAAATRKASSANEEGGRDSSPIDMDALQKLRSTR